MIYKGARFILHRDRILFIDLLIGIFCVASTISISDYKSSTINVHNEMI